MNWFVYEECLFTLAIEAPCFKFITSILAKYIHDIARDA